MKNIGFIFFGLIFSFMGIELNGEKIQPEIWKFVLKAPESQISLTSKTRGAPVIVWEDTSCKGIPLEEIKIGNLCLSKKILSGSKLTLYSDRLGTWEYDFGMRRLPEEYFDLSEEEKVKYLMNVYPYNKRLKDPVEPFNQIIVSSNDLKIRFHHKRITKISYHVDFGPDFEVVGLLVWPWDYHPEDGTGGGGSGIWTKADEKGDYQIDIIVSEDAEGEKVIAKRSCTEEEIRKVGLRSGGPFYFPLNGVSSFYITIKQSKGESTYLAGGHFKAFLRYKGNSWPIIKEGENNFSYSEKSYGERTVELSINKEILFPGFSDSFSELNITGKNCLIEKIPPEKCSDSFVKNSGILKISPDENFLKEDRKKRGFYFVLNLPDNFCNLENIKSIRITYRVPTTCGRLQLGATGIYGNISAIRHIPMGAPPIIPDTRQPIPYWTTYEKKIPSSENMGKVQSFIINSWGPTWALSENDKFCLEIGGIEFIVFEPGEKEKEEKIKQEKILWEKRSKESSIYQRLKEKTLPSGKKINPREIFARGVWGVPWQGERRFGCNDVWEYREKILNDLKSHHLNAFHFNCYGDNEEEFENFVKLASEKGFYIWCVGPVILPKDPGVLKNEWPSLKEEFKKRIFKWKDVPTIIAWAIDEEPDIWALPYLKEAREIMKEINSQPQIIIYNKENVLLEDVKNQPYPGGVCMDNYPILVWGTRFDRYLDYLKTTYEAAKKCGGVAWFVPQFEGSGIRRVPTRSELKFQIWSAIAYNIKGIFPWHYMSVKNDDFSDKPVYKYYSEEMAKIETLEKILIAIEKNDNLGLLKDLPEGILVSYFSDRYKNGFHFAILVNTDLINSKKVYLTPLNRDDIIIEISTSREKILLNKLNSNIPIEIEPGDGRLFFIGSEKELEVFQKSLQLF